MEMGFDEKEVVDALRVNNNQQNAAVSTTSFLFLMAIIICSTDFFSSLIDVLVYHKAQLLLEMK